MTLGMLVILSSRRYGPGFALRLVYRTIRRTWRNIRHYTKHFIYRMWIYSKNTFYNFFQSISEWNDSE